VPAAVARVCAKWAAKLHFKNPLVLNWGYWLMQVGHSMEQFTNNYHLTASGKQQCSHNFSKNCIIFTLNIIKSNKIAKQILLLFNMHQFAWFSLGFQLT